MKITVIENGKEVPLDDMDFTTVTSVELFNAILNKVVPSTADPKSNNEIYVLELQLGSHEGPMLQVFPSRSLADMGLEHNDVVFAKLSHKVSALASGKGGLGRLDLSSMEVSEDVLMSPVLQDDREQTYDERPMIKEPSGGDEAEDSLLSGPRNSVLKSSKQDISYGGSGVEVGTAGPPRKRSKDAGDVPKILSPESKRKSVLAHPLEKDADDEEKGQAFKQKKAKFGASLRVDTGVGDAIRRVSEAIINSPLVKSLSSATFLPSGSRGPFRVISTGPKNSDSMFFSLGYLLLRKDVADPAVVMRNLLRATTLQNATRFNNPDIFALATEYADLIGVKDGLPGGEVELDYFATYFNVDIVLCDVPPELPPQALQNRQLYMQQQMAQGQNGRNQVPAAQAQRPNKPLLFVFTGKRKARGPKKVVLRRSGPKGYYAPIVAYPRNQEVCMATVEREEEKPFFRYVMTAARAVKDPPYLQPVDISPSVLERRRIVEVQPPPFLTPRQKCTIVLASIGLGAVVLMILALLRISGVLRIGI